MINSPVELAVAIGVDNPERIARAIYKHTDCGCIFNYDIDRVTVAGYAEGADAECEPHTLTFPFSDGDFWAAVQAADEEGCEMWREWNAQEDTR